MVVSEILELDDFVKIYFETKKANRDGGSSPLKAAYTVDTDDMIYTVYTIQTALHCLNIRGWFPKNLETFNSI